VRFCKPDKRQLRSAKRDTEDSDTEDSDMSTKQSTDGHSTDHHRLPRHSNDGAQRGSVTRITGTP
jgi:hypothetical protein